MLSLICFGLILLFSLVIVLFICNSKEKFEDTSNDRLKFYLGNLANKPVSVKYSDIDIDETRKVYLIDENILHETFSGNEVISTYFREIQSYYRLLKNRYSGLDARFVFIPGDIGHSRNDIPVIAKTRPIKNPGLNVLLPLNMPRHWDIVKKARELDVIKWSDKKPTIVWRGVATGVDKRVPLVETWAPFPDKSLIDVALTKFNDSYTGSKNSNYIGEYYPLEKLLEYKYLISVEGNDVASNLKWVLSTKTVCIMPEPTIDSWLMESRLKPWVHYVPVKSDFSDLLSIYKYCESHPDHMEKIMKNAHRYMEQFDTNEMNLTMEVLRGYCELTNIYF